MDLMAAAMMGTDGAHCCGSVYGEMENYVVNQLPELDSLPDGFVDSSADPLTPSSPTPDQEDDVPDCKEGRLLKVDSRNDSVGDDSQSCEGDDGSAEQARALTVELSECGSCDEQKLVETPAEDCKDESDVGSPNLVFENVVGKSEQEMAPSADGNKNAAPSCQNLGKSNEQGVEVQAALAQGTLSSESSGTSRKRAPLETTGIRGSGHFLVVWQNLPNLLPTLSFHQSGGLAIKKLGIVDLVKHWWLWLEKIDLNQLFLH
ncbi:hypothetical protein M8C21_012223 [Ambrosia artemisiifolia]|uniref:Uncharacterized protein n=1 Tax=Ambrosia artemisiifolia TaxID=4212 RepID=A0AAD5G6U9_AMBAR|nr:hypothetical protein M8C21_012223 [Ambrosia artemisiifolia]